MKFSSHTTSWCSTGSRFSRVAAAAVAAAAVVFALVAAGGGIVASLRPSGHKIPGCAERPGGSSEGQVRRIFLLKGVSLQLGAKWR